MSVYRRLSRHPSARAPLNNGKGDRYIDSPNLVDHVHAWHDREEGEATGDDGVGEGLGGVSVVFVERRLVGGDEGLAGSL